MATKSFEELNTGALTIKNNELPESNTHTLVGNQLVDMVAKEQEIDGQVAQLRSSIPEVVQTTGTSTIEVMSQDATTKELWAKDALNLLNNISLCEASSPVKGNSYLPLVRNNLTASENNPTSGSAYYYLEPIYRLLRNKKIRYAYVNIAAVGKLSFWNGVNVGLGGFSETLIKEFDISTTGWQILDFGSIITLADGECIGFGNKNDTAVFNYMGRPAIGPYYTSESDNTAMFQYAEGGSWTVSGFWLNVGFGNTNNINSIFGTLTERDENSYAFSLNIGTPLHVSRGWAINLDFRNQKIEVLEPKRNSPNEEGEWQPVTSNMYISTGQGNSLNYLSWSPTLQENQFAEYGPTDEMSDGIFALVIVNDLTAGGRYFKLFHYSKWSTIIGNSGKYTVIGTMYFDFYTATNIAKALPSISSICTVTEKQVEVMSFELFIKNAKLQCNGITVEEREEESQDADITDILPYGAIGIGASVPNFAGYEESIALNHTAYTSKLAAQSLSGKYVSDLLMQFVRGGLVDIFVVSDVTFDDTSGDLTSYSYIKYLKRVKVKKCGLQRLPINHQLGIGETIFVRNVNSGWQYYTEVNTVLYNAEDWGFFSTERGTAMSGRLNLCFLTYESESDYKMQMTKLYPNYTNYSSPTAAAAEIAPYLIKECRISTQLSTTSTNYYYVGTDPKKIGAFIKSMQVNITTAGVFEVYSVELGSNNFISNVFKIGSFDLTKGWQEIELNYQLGPNRAIAVKNAGSGFGYSYGSGWGEWLDFATTNATPGKYFGSLGIYFTYTTKEHKQGIYEGYAVQPTRQYDYISNVNTDATFKGYFYGEAIQSQFRGKELRSIEFFSLTDKTQFTIGVWAHQGYTTDNCPNNAMILVRRIVLAAKKGWNLVQFSTPIILGNNESLSFNCSENSDWTNETQFAWYSFFPTNIELSFNPKRNKYFVTMGSTETANPSVNYGDLCIALRTHDSPIYCPTIEERLSGYAKLVGKKISFLGDSITTFQNWIPTGNAVYYPQGDVNNVAKTYWMRCLSKFNMVLATNEAWSGSRLTQTAGVRASAIAPERWGRLRTNGETGEDPDIIVIHISTNDFTNGVVLGDFDFGDTPNLNQVRPAWCYLLKKLMQTYHKAEIYVCTILQRQKDQTYFPEKNSALNTVADFNQVIREVCDLMGVKMIDLNKCGFTPYNFNGGQMEGGENIYSLDGLHPNSVGMDKVADFMDEALFNH